ncbi:MAG: hypothetical protein HZC10_03580 [Nitrospirae bacterium]|nr:hypothetical protein [Nitrospirota bacterium]
MPRKEAAVLKWLENTPRALVLEALRMAIDEKRKVILKTEKQAVPQPPAPRNSKQGWRNS